MQEQFPRGSMVIKNKAADERKLLLHFRKLAILGENRLKAHP